MLDDVDRCTRENPRVIAAPHAVFERILGEQAGLDRVLPIATDVGDDVGDPDDATFQGHWPKMPDRPAPFDVAALDDIVEFREVLKPGELEDPLLVFAVMRKGAIQRLQ